MDKKELLEVVKKTVKKKMSKRDLERAAKRKAKEDASWAGYYEPGRSAPMNHNGAEYR